MPIPVGEKRKQAICLRLEQKMSTSEIARRLGVSYPCAYRYVKKYPLTKEENRENYENAINKRWHGYIKKPKKRDLVRQRVHTHNHYVKNKKQYIERNKKTADRIRSQVQNIKATTPCMDCGGIFHFSAIDFDHRDGCRKSFNVARMYHLGSMARIMEEIAKCDIVCSNCHRVRTYNRALVKFSKRADIV